jgi:hypothetical protein
MNMYKNRIRQATDEQLQAIVAFFDAPELRKYYAGLIEDARCELQLRAAKGEEGHDATARKP